MIFSETNTKIAVALAKAWGSIENPKHNTNVVVKTKTGSQYTFDYTDLGGIMDEAKRVFKENGVAIIQSAHSEESEQRLYVAVETMLLHSSGEWVKSEPLRMIANPSIQDMGGQITYMKRYSLSAMLGIATEKDDDANGASGNEVQYTTPNGDKKLSEAQVMRLFAIAKTSGINVAQVKQAVMKDYNKTEVASLTKQQYDELCNRLEVAGKDTAHAQ